MHDVLKIGTRVVLVPDLHFWYCLIKMCNQVFVNRDMSLTNHIFAIFLQCIQGLPEGGLRRIILTASGGAFRFVEILFQPLSFCYSDKVRETCVRALRSF